MRALPLSSRARTAAYQSSREDLERPKLSGKLPLRIRLYERLITTITPLLADCPVRPTQLPRRHRMNKGPLTALPPQKKTVGIVQQTIP